MNLLNDKRKKNRMILKEVYNSEGLAASIWSGHKDDYLDTALPEGPLDMLEIPYVPIYITGGWDQIDPVTDETWVTDKQFPYGGKDGVSFTARRGGLVRAYAQEDNTQRLCLYPVSKLGFRDFAPIDRVLTVPEGGTIVLPKGGLFILVQGSVEIKKKVYSDLQFIRAKTEALTITYKAGTRGAGAWRL